MTKFKKFKGLSNKFKTWGKEAATSFDYLPPAFSDFKEQVNTDLTELTNRLGDRKLAERVIALQSVYPNGTVPELVTMDWLKRGGWRYVYQAELYGGRADKGGLLPDFVVEAGSGMAWQIQGEYWHGRNATKAVSDAEAALRLTGQSVGGIRIDKVVNLWESDIYAKRPQIFYYALAGLGLR